MRKKIFYFFQSIIIYIFYLLSKIIGLKLSRIFFSLIFIKLGNLFKSKKIILNNLERIKPGINKLEKRIDLYSKKKKVNRIVHKKYKKINYQLK